MVTLILSFFFFLCYVGMETTFGGLIMTFAVEYAHWTKPQGAIVTAIFWGSLAVGRGFAIFVSNCCKHYWEHHLTNGRSCNKNSSRLACYFEVLFHPIYTGWKYGR
jgi:hypothetical protein